MSPVLHRPKSSLGLRTEQDLGSNPLVTVPFGSMIRGKSLPSIHIDVTTQCDMATRDEQDRLRDEVTLRRERHNSSMEHLQRPSVAPPTITVTEHSPVSSMQFLVNQVRSRQSITQKITPNDRPTRYTFSLITRNIMSFISASSGMSRLF